MGNLIKQKDFGKWVSEISLKYRQAQIKASIKVNNEMLKFYFELGKEITDSSYKAVYGISFYDSLSQELISNLHDVTGLSPRNLRYIERFYQFYKEAIQNDPRLQEQLFSIPWGHHRFIFDKCKSVEKALFFIQQTLANNWSRDVLSHFLNTDLFERNGKAINNFEFSMPQEDSDLAKQITKDPYNFDFLSLTKDYNERELKEALVGNMQRFLLELGTGFSFVGKEHRLLVGETEIYADLLFYNIKIHAYVVVEIKTTDFKPAYLGQLGTYVTAVNHMLKGPDDKPTVGMLICKGKDKTIAEYSMECYNIPMGISSFDLEKIMPKELKNSLPSIEDLESKFSD